MDCAVFTMEGCEPGMEERERYERRLKQHNAGKASKYTRSRLPAGLICVREDLADRSSALRLELKVKAVPQQKKRRTLLGTL